MFVRPRCVVLLQNGLKRAPVVSYNLSSLSRLKTTENENKSGWLEQKRFVRNFGHGKEKTHPVYTTYVYAVFLGMGFMFLNWGE